MSERYRVTIGYDEAGAECPCHAWDTVYQMVSGKRHDTHALDAGGHPTGVDYSLTTDEFKALAAPYTLSVYEHSGIKYSLSGEGPPDYGGWDTAEGGAVLVVKAEARDEWEAMSVEQRIANARGFLNEFNAWANGEVYWFGIASLETCNLGETHEVGEFNAMGGFYGSPEDSGLLEAIAGELPGGATPEGLEVTGDASYLADVADIFKERERIDAALNYHADKALEGVKP